MSDKKQTASYPADDCSKLLRTNVQRLVLEYLCGDRAYVRSCSSSAVVHSYMEIKTV